MKTSGGDGEDGPRDTQRRKQVRKREEEPSPGRNEPEPRPCRSRGELAAELAEFRRKLRG